MLLSAVKLVNGMTEITEASFEVEMRPLMGGTAGFVAGLWKENATGIYYNSGNITIGDTVPNDTEDTLTLVHNDTNTGGSDAMDIRANFVPSGAYSGGRSGIRINPLLDTDETGGGNIAGVRTTTRVDGTTSTVGLRAYVGNIQWGSTGTAGDSYIYLAGSVTVDGGGDVPNLYAFRVNESTQATVNWGFYQLGAEMLNALQGELAVGSVTDFGWTEEGAAIRGQVFIDRQDEASKRALGLLYDGDAAARSAQVAWARSRDGGAAIQNGDTVGRMDWSGHDGTDQNRSAGFYAIVNGTVAANTVPMDLIFETSATNSAGLTERMRIRSNGAVSVNQSTPDNTTFQISGQSGKNTLLVQRNGTTVHDSQEQMSGEECIRMTGAAADYIISVQDGSGRIQHYWNSSVLNGSGNNIAEEDGENHWMWDVAISGDPYMAFKYKDEQGAGSTIDWDVHFTLRSDGQASIGESINNSHMSNGGLNVNLGSSPANTDRVFSARAQGSGIAHGITAFADTSVFYDVGLANNTAGGAFVRGYTELYVGLQIEGYVTTGIDTETTSSLAAVMVDASKKNGTSNQALAADENVFAISNLGTTAFIIKGNGDYYYDGTGTAFDEWDDLGLIEAIQRRLRGPRFGWDQFNRYSEGLLVKLGLLSEGGFVNGAAVQSLFMGTHLQQGHKLQQTREELERTRNENKILQTRVANLERRFADFVGAS